MVASVLLQGEKTLMDVSAWGHHKKMLVQPGVATTEFEMGILVWIFEEDNPEESIDARLWALVTPRNLLACWRGMLILQEVKNLSEGDLCNAYYAGQQEPHRNDEHRIDQISDKIGGDVYDAIMARPVPDEVVDLVIKLADEGEPIALWPITDEVKAGTLQWRDDFERIGAKHPQKVAERKAAEELLIQRYESYLTDYATSNRYSRNCLMMGNIESAIVGAVEKGIETEHGVDVVLGISIARAYGSTAALVAMSGFGSEEHFNKALSEGIREAASWVSSRFKTGRFLKRSKRSEKEYQKVIQQLDAAWNDMPIKQPLTA